MDKMLMINEVAKNYKITKRTLRYYEEIGLLTVIKKNDSNYRYYDKETLNRLEQILLLRDLDFSLSEIKEVLISKDDKLIDKILNNKLEKLHDDINNLFSIKKIITAIINIKRDKGMQRVSIYQILKEQIYIHKNIERVFEMSQFAEEVIIVEFGMNIVGGANAIVEEIKILRQEIKKQLNKEIPLIRVKDNFDLEANEYKIIIKGVTVKKESLNTISQTEMPDIIVNALKEAVLCNLQDM